MHKKEKLLFNIILYNLMNLILITTPFCVDEKDTFRYWYESLDVAKSDCRENSNWQIITIRSFNIYDEQKTNGQKHNQKINIIKKKKKNKRFNILI